MILYLVAENEQTLYDAKYFLNFSIKEIGLDLFNVGNVKYMTSFFDILCI